MIKKCGLAERFREKLQPREEAERDRILLALDRMTVPEAGRKNDEAALSHALGVAEILAELNLDADTIATALLLNFPDRDSLREQFGDNVALMTEGIARIADISATNKTIHEAENIRKMLFAMVDDIRVIFIKLADKLHTMRTLEDFPPEKHKPIAQECLDIYAPLADRLGISWMKDELEDLALKHLNREVYLRIKEIVALKKSERREFLDAIQQDITREAAATGIPIAVESRAKHFYSIYQKMRKRNKGIEDLYDLFGIRILCDKIENCYTLLGLVHHSWKPLEGRFKDYIAMPKSNGYRSLHTTVMSTGGQLLEIQIRTREMHHVAEYGVASHWLYKKGTTKEIVHTRDIPLINRLKDWKITETENGENRPSESFLEDIKRELLRDSIYVFTPRGKVIELPVGATPIDFAYHIHSAIGEHCGGAKANGVIIPLNSALQNTQVVEILTSTNAHPHINWLRIVKTAKARNKIRAWLQQNDDSVIIEKNVVARKKSPPPAQESEAAKGREGSGDRDKNRDTDLSLQRVLPHEGQDMGVIAVRVEDEKNMMIRFAKCCNPVAGDAIVGYVSRGRGIIIHRKNCSNLTNIPDFAERRIDTQWENADLLVRRFKVESRLQADLFAAIEGAIRKYQGHLLEGRLEETGVNHLTGFFTMQLEQQEDLRRILKNIRGIPAVYSILELTGTEDRD
ncbi:MAG: RelA/SpoT family protein [Spirochaetaceae bacterium]|jgi:GTP pyrophosphokinase|nr:RelA/SpoT family protein [Spirochaetaceae bacterium]